MTEQVKTEDYRDVLEELAISRGLSGAEELARRAVEAEPRFTVRSILEDPEGGYGHALDEVLVMSGAEKRRVSDAFARTFLSRRRDPGICRVPGCKRPAIDDAFGCVEHTRHYDACADEEGWDLAIGILRPWVEATRLIGSEELTRLMEGALAEAERELNRVLDELEAAEAALGESGEEEHVN